MFLVIQYEPISRTAEDDKELRFSLFETIITISYDYKYTYDDTNTDYVDVDDELVAAELFVCEHFNFYKIQ